MEEFTPGQRWISTTEPGLGLGMVSAVEHRTVTVSFPAGRENRTYSREDSPLSRVVYSHGDRICSEDGLCIEILSLSEQDGLVRYRGVDDDGRNIELHEEKLESQVKFLRPAERLFNGQIDSNHWFNLRQRTLAERQRLLAGELRGLGSARTSLIPHQLYIAHEVSRRWAPRVLLADEVGLGKTIEAGLIIHQQLLSERARRVLIVVPESLVHQWLVEMLRRFNLCFSLFSESRCQAAEQGGGYVNPFDSEQLVLCSLEFLTGNNARHQQAVDAHWDLLAVDEAHHLHWSPAESSPEYSVIAALAKRASGVLLLTGTPQQAGVGGHFARLRLIDPDRFCDYQAFVEEQAGYSAIADAVTDLLGHDKPGLRTLELLKQTFAEGDNHDLVATLLQARDDAGRAAREELVEHLLDRHGTGRVMFRNTRAVVGGFPQRELRACALDMPREYEQTGLGNTGNSDLQRLLSPELAYQQTTPGASPHWTRFDPRLPWLVDTLSALTPQKGLVIVHAASSVLDLAEWLRKRAGIQAALFLEGMSIVERDRSAAFFADPDKGSQLLICSEIGSEGRNFQFARHLIMLDLPADPELLEQRIGRLDRIGQGSLVCLHVPYLRNSAQQIMFRWFDEGLGAFVSSCPAAGAVFTQTGEQLRKALLAPREDCTQLLEQTRQLSRSINADLNRGRDRLLEYNSCRPAGAERIRTKLENQDRHNRPDSYMEPVLDAFGVNSEPGGSQCLVITPGPHMPHPLPGLPEDGMTVTFDRNTALANEDVHFMTWDHPLVSTVMEMIESSEHGNTAVTTVKYSGLAAGSLLLEAVFALETAGTEALNASHYLPPVFIRTLVDERGQSHDALSASDAENLCQDVGADIAVRVVRASDTRVRKMLADSENIATRQVPALLATAQRRCTGIIDAELNRLHALQRLNAGVRESEVTYFRQQRQMLTSLFDRAGLRLDALRIMVVT